MSAKNQTPNATENETPKQEVDGKTVVTQDEFLNLKIDDAISAKIKLMNLNKIELGCSVVDKKVNPGKAKKDAQG